MPSEAVQKPHSHPAMACSQDVANQNLAFDVSRRQCAPFLTSFCARSACTVPHGRFRACTPRLLGIPMIGRQDDLGHDERVVGAGADIVVVEARIRCIEVQLMIDHVVQREFKGAALDLLGQHHGQEARAAVNGFVAGPGFRRQTWRLLNTGCSGCDVRINPELGFLHNLKG